MKMIIHQNLKLKRSNLDFGKIKICQACFWPILGVRPQNFLKKKEKEKKVSALASDFQIQI